MTRKQKKRLLQILVAAGFYFATLVFSNLGVAMGSAKEWTVLGLYLGVYGLVGYRVIWKAVRNIAHGQVFDENFLMCLATFGAFGVREYAEAVAVMLFYQIGEWFEDFAVSRSRKSIGELMDICPEYANIEEDGALKQVDPNQLEIGDMIIVKPGERIPLDGVIISGNSLIDTSALTGESVPREAQEGDKVVSGCINGEGTLKVEVSSRFENSTVKKILELVENASARKSGTENFITKFARYYTPIVVIGAVLLAVGSPLLTEIGWAESIRRACIFLVISCPCALVISVPLSFFGGIGAASRAGILVKGSNYLEAVSHMNVVVFDKTGTLTKGDFVVSQVCPVTMEKEEFLKLAAHTEGYSNHPIAASLREAYGKELDLSQVTQVSEDAGQGIRATVNGHQVLAGNERQMKGNQIQVPNVQETGTVVYLAVDGTFAGYLLIEDEVKPEAKEAIRLLKTAGVEKTIMLTGDKNDIGQKVAAYLGIDEVYTELLPQDKVNKAEELLQENQTASAGKGKLAFVGDGINDAPVLARCDIGIAMGSMGSDAAIEAADVVLMDDCPKKIAFLKKIAKKTMTIVVENITFALGVKLVVLMLGTFGLANMWEAVFADVGVSVLAIINATRALKIKQ